MIGNQSMKLFEMKKNNIFRKTSNWLISCNARIAVFIAKGFIVVLVVAV